MINADQCRLADAFRAMHHGPPLLLLPNAWDAISARLFEAAGFPAVATTSGGVAWSLGYQNGEHAPWPEVVAATRRIARIVEVPVSADIEMGYGETPSLLAANVKEIIAAGAVGITIEDGNSRARERIRTTQQAAKRICAAHQAGLLTLACRSSSTLEPMSTTSISASSRSGSLQSSIARTPLSTPAPIASSCLATSIPTLPPGWSRQSRHRSISSGVRACRAQGSSSASASLASAPHPVPR